MSATPPRKRPPRDTRVVSGRISPQMFDAVKKIVDTGNYVDMTDYLRDMIRRDLKERNVTIQ